MFCSRIVCYAALGIRYASDDDVVISSWFHRDVFHQAEISAKGLGRFFFMFMAPLSSSLLQIESDGLFNLVHLLPYVLGALGFATFVNQIGGRRFPLSLTLAICIAFTPTWNGYTPVLGYPWWLSFGFAAFIWGTLTWLKWCQTHRFRWAFLTFLLISVALCTVEAFVLMLAVPAVVIGWRLTTANRQRPFNCWLRSGIVAASPGVLAVLAYIVVYWVFRLQNPSTYDGNQLSFAFPQMFMTWFQATVTPLPGWNFLRSNDFSSDLPLLSNKLAAFACAQPFYATKALLVGLSVFVFCYPMAVPTEREKLPLGPLMMVCVIGSLSPNLLMSLTIKHQQVADLAYQPYFYSFYSLPFCLFGGLLLFTTLTTQVSVVARLVFIGGGAVLAGILSLSNDFVSSARVSILRDNNLKWRAADHLESSGCLADLPQNALVYAASLDWGADYWSNYFATRTGRKLAISLESPPNIAVPDETPRFVFSYSSSPTGDGYFWQFGPLAGDVEERRKIQIGEYSKRQRYRLAAFVSTDEVFQIEADGTTFCGQKDSFDGIPIRKREGGSDDTFALQVRSKGFPTFAAVKEPLDSAKPVALNTPLHFAKDGNGTKCLLSGWSQPEAWGVWSDGDHASLLVPLKSVGSDLVLELDVSGFVTSKCPQQLINVRVNEVPVGEIFFSLDRPEGMRRLWISAEVAQREHGKLLIDFRCENPTSPKIAGISEDPRELALALRTLRITD